MRILIVGAAGVLGRATLPHLEGHDVTGTTRSPGKRAALAALGARPEICDVYEPGALERVAAACSPEVVVNFLTDLGDGPGPANSRIRREGGPVVTAAALACSARRLVVESISFDPTGTLGGFLEPPATTPPGEAQLRQRAVGEDAAAAVAVLEESCLGSGLDAVVLRFGRFWGPDTWTETAPEPPSIHITEAGRRAASLIVAGPPGIHVVADPAQ